jgi:hypothetical protein
LPWARRCSSIESAHPSRCCARRAGWATSGARVPCAQHLPPRNPSDASLPPRNPSDASPSRVCARTCAGLQVGNRPARSRDSSTAGLEQLLHRRNRGCRSGSSSGCTEAACTCWCAGRARAATRTVARVSCWSGAGAADQLRGGPCRLRTGHRPGAASARTAGARRRGRRVAAAVADRVHRRRGYRRSNPVGGGAHGPAGALLVAGRCLVVLHRRSPLPARRVLDRGGLHPAGVTVGAARHGGLAARLRLLR